MKIVSLILSLFVVVTTASAQSGPEEKSLLWEISGKGLTKPSYLFGTIHLICSSDFSISPQLKNSIAQTQQLALEIDMDDPGLMAAMTKSMFMKEDKKLTDILSEKDYNQLKQYYKDSLKMDISAFGKAKPFMMIGPIFNKILGCEPQSYELTLMGMAGNQKSEIIGLETIEEQMAIFDTIPYDKQADMLVTMINKMPESRKEFRDMVELYKQQDVQGLYDLTSKSEFGLDRQDDVMLFRRNQNWISRIDKMVHEKPTFIAVGAAHLGGDKGVIALLRNAGYKVMPVAK